MKEIKLVKRVNLKDLIYKKAHDGKIFRVDFVKKDGTNRKIICRLKVKKDIKGKRKKLDFDQKLLIPYINVFDMKKNGWRKINLDTIYYLKIHGVEYKLID